MIKRQLIRAFQFYQRRISVLFPPVCRFDPTCSQYMIEAIEQWGSLIGVLLGIRRFMKCQPLFHGGYDPVPKRKQKQSEADNIFLEKVGYHK